MLNVVAQARIGWEETIDSVLRQLFKKREECEDSTIHRSFYTGLLEKLDSGGEKEIDWRLKEAMSSKSSPYIPLDSKPPEPTHEDDLKEILDTDMPITILAHIKKRVRDATRQEPREDDWNQNSFILVKREDLERWKKEFEKSGHPEWEYIEEEYGIE